MACKTVPAKIEVTPYTELVAPPERPYLAPIQTLQDAGIRLTNTISHIERQETYIKRMEKYYLTFIEIISK
jgi:hypothetical protein